MPFIGKYFTFGTVSREYLAAVDAGLESSSVLCHGSRLDLRRIYESFRSTKDPRLAEQLVEAHLRYAYAGLIAELPGCHVKIRDIGCLQSPIGSIAAQQESGLIGDVRRLLAQSSDPDGYSQVIEFEGQIPTLPNIQGILACQQPQQALEERIGQWFVMFRSALLQVGALKIYCDFFDDVFPGSQLQLFYHDVESGRFGGRMTSLHTAAALGHVTQKPSTVHYHVVEGMIPEERGADIAMRGHSLVGLSLFRQTGHLPNEHPGSIVLHDIGENTECDLGLSHLFRPVAENSAA